MHDGNAPGITMIYIPANLLQGARIIAKDLRKHFPWGNTLRSRTTKNSDNEKYSITNTQKTYNEKISDNFTIMRIARGNSIFYKKRRTNINSVILNRITIC